jgi:hypothetical protein
MTMLTDRKDRLYPWVMGWLVFTTIVMPQLVLTRTLVQSDYRWSYAGFSGTGMRGDLWFVITLFAFVAAMLWLGWRGARMPFHIMATLWTSALTLRLIEGIIEHGRGMRFRGDTLGINVWLGWFIPVYVLFTALILWWAIRDFRFKRQRAKLAWSRRNVIGLGVAGGLWLIAFALFREGKLHGPSDVAAVFCMFAFWIALNVGGLRMDKRAVPRTTPV